MDIFSALVTLTKAWQITEIFTEVDAQANQERRRRQSRTSSPDWFVGSILLAT